MVAVRSVQLPLSQAERFTPSVCKILMRLFSHIIYVIRHYPIISLTERIQEHNTQTPTPSYTLGHNAYSDMTESEFAQFFKLGEFSDAAENKARVETKLMSSSEDTAEKRRKLMEQAPLELPDFVDWVQLGAVTPIKNQGACGSCWAFSTTGSLEGSKFLKTGELTALSEQNLIDCDHVDLGCNGGLMDNAFKFDEKSGGLCSETDYPYQAKQGTCNTECTDVPGSIVSTFVDVPPGDEQALISALPCSLLVSPLKHPSLSFSFTRPVFSTMTPVAAKVPLITVSWRLDTVRISTRKSLISR
jgi:hypothetical protein